MPQNWREALGTLFSMNNETANVWSALIGVVPMSCIAINAWAIKHPDWDPVGIYIAIFMFGINIAVTSCYHL